MATGVGLRQVSLTQLNLPTPKTPSLLQESGTYLLQKPSYRKFSVEILTFSLPWQWVSMRQISLMQLNSLTPKTPCLVQESGTLSYRSRDSKFSVKIFKCSLSWQQGSVWGKYK